MVFGVGSVEIPIVDKFRNSCWIEGAYLARRVRGRPPVRIGLYTAHAYRPGEPSPQSRK